VITAYVGKRSGIRMRETYVCKQPGSVCGRWPIRHCGNPIRERDLLQVRSESPGVKQRAGREGVQALSERSRSEHSYRHESTRKHNELSSPKGDNIPDRVAAWRNWVGKLDHKTTEP